MHCVHGEVWSVWCKMLPWRKGGETYMYALGIKCLLSQIARGGGGGGCEDNAAASRRGRDDNLEEDDVEEEEVEVEDEVRSSTRARRVRRRMRKTGHQWARRCWLWWRWLKAWRMGRSGEREDAGEVVDGGCGGSREVMVSWMGMELGIACGGEVKMVDDGV